MARLLFRRNPRLYPFVDRDRFNQTIELLAGAISQRAAQGGCAGKSLLPVDPNTLHWRAKADPIHRDLQSLHTIVERAA